VKTTYLFGLLISVSCTETTFHTKLDHIPGTDTAEETPQDTPTVTDSGGPTEPIPDTAETPDTGGPPDTETPPDTDAPDTFSLGWHILDESVPIATDTNPAHFVDHHGDTDLYWYEPSGVHGLIDSADSVSDFLHMREYVIERVPDPTMGIGLLHFYADSALDTFALATFTYVLCDFWVDETDDPGLYILTTGPVDDGIQVMLNGETMGHLKLDDPGGSWELGSHIKQGERNTLIVLLVDDSARNKFIQDMGFYRDGIMVTGT
jgi:hypothetical protein